MKSCTIRLDKNINQGTHISHVVQKITDSLYINHLKKTILLTKVNYFIYYYDRWKNNQKNFLHQVLLDNDTKFMLSTFFLILIGKNEYIIYIYDNF